MKSANILVQDDDGHWYVIPSEYEDTFEKWVSSDDPEIPKWCDRVDNPHRVQFTDWWEV